VPKHAPPIFGPMAGSPPQTLHIPDWCCGTTAYLPLPVGDGWWHLVPIWEPDQTPAPLRRWERRESAPTAGGLMGLPVDGGPPAPRPLRGRQAYRRYAVGQRRRLSCPTRRSSSATRWRRVAFSAWSRATVAAVSLARVCRQRAMRHRGEQTRCGRRPVRGRPQTAHRPALAAYVRLQARRQARGNAGRPRRRGTRARAGPRGVDTGSDSLGPRAPWPSSPPRPLPGGDGVAARARAGCGGVASRAAIYHDLHTGGPELSPVHAPLENYKY
jgi:hypothetical protein